MKRSWAATVASLSALALLGLGAPASGAPDAGESAERAPVGTVLDNFTFVGHSPLDGFNDYGDLDAHGDFAYIGSRCSPTRQGGDGVQVVDISHPKRPQPVSKLPNPPFTRAEDVTVLDVHTPTFTGALAVVGIQTCSGSGHEAEVIPGLHLFDVTHPNHPTLLAHWDLPQGTIGCHEIDAVQRADGQLLLACARNLRDHERSNGTDSLHLVDATNPTNPHTLTNWTLANPDGGVGCLPNQFAHSARFEDGGNSLYVSNWDAGTVHLNITTPTTPKTVSITKILPPDEDGDNHSMTLANNGNTLIINTEDFSPGDCPDTPSLGAWGEVYLYDNTNPAAPTFLGTFSTPNSRSTRTDGSFTDHNTEVTPGGQLFSSWYSDGIIWWTLADHGVTHQRGQFVPPPRPDGSLASIWGVHIDTTHNLILASDTRTGLWITKPKGLNHF